MNEAEFTENVEQARDYMDDEANRTRGGFMPGGLGGQQEQAAPSSSNKPPSFRLTSSSSGPAQPRPGFGTTSRGDHPPEGGSFRPPQQPARQPTQRFGPDPGLAQHQGPQSSTVDVQTIRALVPQLAHLSDDYILGQPIDALYRLNREEKQAAAQAEVSKAAKGLDIRLHANAKKAAENPIFIEGWDNR